MPELKKILIVIAGPTAVGKTAVAVALARHFNTVIISADSRQIYKELNIGTAKPHEADLATVKHYFINSHSIQEDFDAARFGEETLKLIHKLFNDKSHIVLCGGSGLYIKAVCEGFDDIPDIPEEIREDLMAKYQEKGLSWLQERMRMLDPGYFSNIDQQNPQRLVRALEVKIGTGLSISNFQMKKKLEHSFVIKKIGLELDRQELYRRIDQRMDKMIEDGLFEEAKELYPFRSLNALQTVGYQEIFDYMEGKYDREEATRLLKRNSRRYAKRQLTWFKRDPDITWLRPDNFDKILETVNS